MVDGPVMILPTKIAVVADESVYTARLCEMPLSLLLKFTVTFAPAGTVIVFLSKAMFCATRSTVTGAPADEAVGAAVAEEVGTAVAEEVGAAVADEDGAAVADAEGAAVADEDGAAVAEAEGAAVAEAEGEDEIDGEEEAGGAVVVSVGVVEVGAVVDEDVQAVTMLINARITASTTRVLVLNLVM